MQISVNGNTKEFTELSVSVSHLLNSEKILNTNGIAVAVNNEVVSKDKWEFFQIKNQDNVLIIRAAQGG
jgi:sulfur carrier protein